MATKQPADEPQTQTTPPVTDPAKDPQAAQAQAEQLAKDEAKAQEQADADRDELAKAAQEADGPTPVPANFEDIAAQARVAEEQAQQQAKDAPDQSGQSTRPDGEAKK